MKKNHFELKNYVMATGVFILAVVAGILIFFECVQRAVQVNSQNTVTSEFLGCSHTTSFCVGG